MTFSFDSTKHAYTLDGKPLVGTTTLIGEMFPPPLTWWASGMALEKMGWLNPKNHSAEEVLESAWTGWTKIREMPSGEFADFLQECYRNHNTFKERAGAHGTDIHALIEDWINLCISDSEGTPDSPFPEEIKLFAEWAKVSVGKFLYSEALVYSEILWLAGTLDFIYEKDGKTYLGDIKTSKSIYPSHFIQMGLYDCQQGENGFYTAKGEKIGESVNLEAYTIVNLPKEGGIKTKTLYDVEGLREFGSGLVQTHKIKRQLEEQLK
jgi:hypothetical protein